MSQHPSVYDKYWFLIRDHRWKTSEPNDPQNRIVLEIPSEQQAKVIHAIRNRKWKEQFDKGKEFGILRAVRTETEVTFWLIPPAVEKV